MNETVGTSGGTSAGTVPSNAQPVRVIIKRRERKHRKNSSRTTRRMSEIERRVSRALRRVTRAMNHGMNTYIDQRNDSRDRRKDGVVVDFMENVSYGVSKTMAEASPLVHDLAEAWNTRMLRRQMRTAARTFRLVPF